MDKASSKDYGEWLSDLTARGALRLEVAQRYLEGYLRIVGVDDPDARVTEGSPNWPLNFRRGDDETARSRRASYSLPEAIIIEINREKDPNFGPYDPSLVDVIARANEGKTIEGSIAECLREHYKRANISPPVSQPKAAYWEQLKSNQSHF